MDSLDVRDLCADHSITAVTTLLQAVIHVSFSPDGKRLASGGGDTTVRFWDVNTCLPAHTCKGHRDHVLCTAWSPDGKRFASADKKGEIRLWDPKTGKQVGEPLK